MPSRLYPRGVLETDFTGCWHGSFHEWLSCDALQPSNVAYCATNTATFLVTRLNILFPSDFFIFIRRRKKLKE
ncbi:hypothetical protein E2C01_009983 [Portunus trituberculatus]|uniref:Uncharacterized protein n=1 Tax=Portunus trituberculatus TaxID=210409 RepID=A0A5B7D7H5_PORTR|nr:hypothetical protein [Portunus trituberculatus]